MRNIDKPERMAALGAPLRSIATPAHPTRRELTVAERDEFQAASQLRDFELGDHLPDGTVLRKGHVVEKFGTFTIHEHELPSGNEIHEFNRKRDAEQRALSGLPPFHDNLHRIMEWSERMMDDICGAQAPLYDRSKQNSGTERCQLIAPDYASMTDEEILAWPEVLLPVWFGVDKAKPGSDDRTVLVISTPTGEGGQFYQQACMQALRDNMRMGVGVCHLPALDMEPAADTPHEEARNLLDDLLVDSADVSVEAMNIISLMVRTAILDACSDEPALLRTLERSYTTVNIVNNVMLRLLGFRVCGAGMVDETVIGAYHPARLQEQRLITDPTDEVLHGQVRRERDCQSPQDHGSTGAGSGAVSAIGNAIAGARGFLRPDRFHDRPGPEAGGGHALRAAEAADGCAQRQGREAGGVAPAVGTAAWLRTEEGHKAMQMMINMTEDQRKAVNTAVRQHLGY